MITYLSVHKKSCIDDFWGKKKDYKYIFVLKKGVTSLFVSFFMTAFMLCALKNTKNCIFPCLFFSWFPPSFLLFQNRNSKIPPSSPVLQITLNQEIKIKTLFFLGCVVPHKHVCPANASIPNPAC